KWRTGILAPWRQYCTVRATRKKGVSARLSRTPTGSRLNVIGVPPIGLLGATGPARREQYHFSLILQTIFPSLVSPADDPHSLLSGRTRDLIHSHTPATIASIRSQLCASQALPLRPFRTRAHGGRLCQSSHET